MLPLYSNVSACVWRQEGNRVLLVAHPAARGQGSSELPIWHPAEEKKGHQVPHPCKCHGGFWGTSFLEPSTCPQINTTFLTKSIYPVSSFEASPSVQRGCKSIFLHNKYSFIFQRSDAFGLTDDFSEVMMRSIFSSNDISHLMLYMLDNFLNHTARNKLNDDLLMDMDSHLLQLARARGKLTISLLTAEEMDQYFEVDGEVRDKNLMLCRMLLLQE